MPIYAYKCDVCGREDDYLMRYEERTLSKPCVCGEQQRLQLSVTAKPVVQGGTNGGTAMPVKKAGFVQVEPGVNVKGSSLAPVFLDWRCTKCGHKDVEIGADAVVPDVCPKCGSATERYINEKATYHDWFPVGGYYDRGAGQFFHTRKERDEWAKANGMVEAAGAFEDTEALVAAKQRRDEEMDEFWRNEIREIEKDPETAKLRERGMDPVPDWLREEVGLGHRGR